MAVQLSPWAPKEEKKEKDMAKRMIIDCDKCGQPTDYPIILAIPNGTERESGGHKVEIYNRYEYKDLCPACAEKLFNYLFKHQRVVKLQDGNFGKYDEGRMIEWRMDKYAHPRPAENDAVALTLKFLEIKER